MVEWKKIENVCTVMTPPKKLKKECYQKEGLYPIIDQGQSDIVGYTDDEGSLLASDSYVLFGDHTRNVKYISGKFAQGADGLKILKCDCFLNPKYFYYTFSNSSIPTRGYSRHWSIAKEIEIPIPPLSEQNRIVGILDTFTESIENLKKQITERKKQYEHYRDQLVDLEGKPGVEMKAMGGMCLIKTGNKPKTIFEKGKYRYINAGTSESGYTNETNCEANVVTTPSRGQGGIGFLAFQPVDFWLGPLCYQIRSIKVEEISNKYLFYYLSGHNDDILKYKSEGGTPAVNAADLKKIPVLYPSLSEQNRIVSILDTFEASIANLEQQLSLRQKQYEYYRNMLLTFDE